MSRRMEFEIYWSLNLGITKYCLQNDLEGRTMVFTHGCPFVHGYSKVELFKNMVLPKIVDLGACCHSRD